MIRPGADTNIVCDECQQPAVIRQLEFISADGRYRRYVPYEMHSWDMASVEHQQAMHRMDSFHERAYALFDVLIPMVTNAELSFGDITGLDFETERPAACKPRTKLRFNVTITANGKQFATETDYIDLPSADETALASVLIAEKILIVATERSSELQALFLKGKL